MGRLRLATIEHKMAAVAALHRHIDECEQCAGPNDGCETGQTLEGVCIYDLGIDPWDDVWRALSEKKEGKP